MFRNWTTLFSGLLIWVAAHATALEPPRATPVLSVSGLIAHTNDDRAAHFDFEMLTQLDWREVETYTSFTDGPQRFAGPTLQSLLEAVGAEGGTLIASAVNDYTIRIPADHAARHDVLLAVEHNGHRMRVRDKGPIWIVYPLTEEEAEAKPFDGEMIWQLVRIEIAP